VITTQCFLTSSGGIKFIEINPRFGGGVPLAIEAGADFPKWILQQLIGQQPKIAADGFEDKLIMLRYDSEVWLELQ
jgi:carbamoyl-phosphate synthase large subunit